LYHEHLLYLVVQYRITDLLHLQVQDEQDEQEEILARMQLQQALAQTVVISQILQSLSLIPRELVETVEIMRELVV